jgi:predicted DNA-binding protein with PD1-like motif
MQYGEGKMGRIFALRLEEGERLNDTIEGFAREHAIQGALVMYLGGATDGSRIVVGPEKDRGEAIVPMIHILSGIQEVLAVGTIFPDESGKPSLHLHGAAGREGQASVGCTRAGVDVWLVGEVVILEILGTHGRRRKDPQSGFQLLQFSQ